MTSDDVVDGLVTLARDDGMLSRAESRIALLKAVDRFLAAHGMSDLGVSSTGQCNTSRSLSAGVWKPKVFRGR